MKDLNELLTNYQTDKSDKNLAELYYALENYLAASLRTIQLKCHYTIRSEHFDDLVSEALFNIYQMIVKDEINTSIAKLSTYSYQAIYFNYMHFIKYNLSKLNYSHNIDTIPEEPPEYEIPNDKYLYISSLDIRTELQEFSDVRKSNEKYALAMDIYRNHGDITKYAIANNINVTTMKTRIFEGRKSFKAFLLSKYSDKILINDL